MPAYGVFSNAGGGHQHFDRHDRHDRHGFHRHELWPHGAGVPRGADIQYIVFSRTVAQK
jgi:hypothetical protein